MNIAIVYPQFDGKYSDNLCMCIGEATVDVKGQCRSLLANEVRAAQMIRCPLKLCPGSAMRVTRPVSLRPSLMVMNVPISPMFVNESFSAVNVLIKVNVFRMITYCVII